MATSALQRPSRPEPRHEAFDPELDSACDGQNEGRSVTLAQYLNTAYTPDCDYIDGHLQERNLGELDHARLHNRLLFLFTAQAAHWQVEAFPELRLQVFPTNFRVPTSWSFAPITRSTA